MLTLWCKTKLRDHSLEGSDLPSYLGSIQVPHCHTPVGALIFMNLKAGECK
jgi:hypothetical protein